MFGRDIRVPKDFSYEPALFSREPAWFEKQKQVNRERQETIRLASEHLRAEQLRRKEYFDEKRDDIQFDIGDLVWLKNQQLPSGRRGITKKFLPKYIGPFRVVKQTSPVNYQLVDTIDGKAKGSFHVERMKRCFQPECTVESLPSIQTRRENETKAVQEDTNPNDERRETARTEKTEEEDPQEVSLEKPPRETRNRGRLDYATLNDTGEKRYG
jgi:hypothetical protein